MIKTLAKFNVDETECSKEEWQPFVFDETKVVNYNQSDEYYTTVEVGYTRLVIAIKFEDFLDIVKPDKIMAEDKAQREYRGQCI